MYKLCTIDLKSCNVLHLEINEEIDDRSTSPYGVQQKMCRDFLSAFSMYGILVTPQRKLSEIMIVGRNDCFSNETIDFQGWLTKEFLTVKSIDRADCLSVEECIRFSIFVWFESYQYYRCGNDLIKGPFFGASSELMRILFTVHCTSVGEVFLRVSPERVRLFPLKTWQVQNRSEEHRWVFCLPKLSRGQVVAQFRQLPNDSVFANYVEMRAYWKNCYGYDLPLEEPQSYCHVLFKGIGGPFLYPDFCVLSAEPEVLHFREDYATTVIAIDEFLQAFTSKKRFICMEEIKLSVVSPKSISLYGRSFGSSTYKRRTSFVTRTGLPRRFASVALKRDVQMEDDASKQTKGIAGFSKTVNFNTGESFATAHVQHGNVVKTSRDRRRFVDVD